MGRSPMYAATDDERAEGPTYPNRVSLLWMFFSAQATALLLPGFIRLGPLRLTVYGIFAAAGLIAALWLSQRTAPRVGLPANKLWDAGVIAVIAAFVASRVLLIAFDFRA